MTGVEILNEIGVRGCSGWLVVGYIILGIISLAAAMFSIGFEERWINIIGVAVGSILLILGVIGFVNTMTEFESFHKEYTIKISDEASFNEVMEKYEIIESENGLYVVKDQF